jgi:hypothetical protein
MRAQSICLAIIVGVLCSPASAQWIQTNGPYSGFIRTLAVSGTNLFAGTYGGVFHSTNNGTSWTAASTGLTNANVWSLAVSGTDLFVGTSSGVWRRPLSEMITTSVEKEEDLSPRRFALKQNYPNPFNPATTINFDLPVKSKVRLHIFNLLGEQVAELANEEVNAGYFQKMWNAGVASGLYFYRLEAISVSDPTKRFVDVKKMIQLK